MTVFMLADPKIGGIYWWDHFDDAGLIALELIKHLFKCMS